jgi:hypothetical protein
LLLADCGVDTRVYKAHSTRAASTSKAKQQGLSVEQIIDRGNWTRAKTFGKFYDKQVGKIDNFQQALFK